MGRELAAPADGREGVRAGARTAGDRLRLASRSMARGAGLLGLDRVDRIVVTLPLPALEVGATGATLRRRAPVAFERSNVRLARSDGAIPVLPVGASVRTKPRRSTPGDSVARDRVGAGVGAIVR